MAQEDQESFEILVYMDAVLDDCSESKTWSLDTSFSNHMICQKAWLTKCDNTRRRKTRLDDSRSLQPKGSSKMAIKEMMVEQ